MESGRDPHLRARLVRRSVHESDDTAFADRTIQITIAWDDIAPVFANAAAHSRRGNTCTPCLAHPWKLSSSVVIAVALGLNAGNEYSDEQSASTPSSPLTPKMANHDPNWCQIGTKLVPKLVQIWVVVGQSSLTDLVRVVVWLHPHGETCHAWRLRSQSQTTTRGRRKQ